MRLLSAERFISVDRRADKTCKSLLSLSQPCLTSEPCGTDLLANVIIWTCIEPSLGIMCGCLPLLHPFFKRYSPEKIVGAHRSGYSSVQTNNPAATHRSAKGFEEYTERVAHFHENVID
jgi:hypothetical protein